MLFMFLRAWSAGTRRSPTLKLIPASVLRSSRTVRNLVVLGTGTHASARRQLRNFFEVRGQLSKRGRAKARTGTCGLSRLLTLKKMQLRALVPQQSLRHLPDLLCVHVRCYVLVDVPDAAGSTIATICVKRSREALRENTDFRENRGTRVPSRKRQRGLCGLGYTKGIMAQRFTRGLFLLEIRFHSF